MKMTNKFKVFYIIWLFINSILLILGFGSPYSYSTKLKYFYPFITDFDGKLDLFFFKDKYENVIEWLIRIFISSAIKYYDFSEYFIYIGLPMVIYYSITILKKK